MSDFPSDDHSIAEFLKDPNRDEKWRDMSRFIYQMKRLEVISPEGKRVPLLYSHKSQNAVIDLRALTSAPGVLPPDPLVLAVAVDDPDLTLLVSWTLGATDYEALYLERSPTDATAFAALVTLPGDATGYDDVFGSADGIEYFYRVRGLRNGLYSEWSNEASGELTPSGCVYVLPSPMAASSPFFQSFAADDFSDANWPDAFSKSLLTADAGYNDHAGSIFLSDDGKKVVVGAAGGLRCVTRNSDDTFTVEVVNVNGATDFLFGWFMGRTGLLVGGLESQGGAVWDSGVTSAPTIDAGVIQWNYVNYDGTKLYGVTTDFKTIERINGVDTIIAPSGYTVDAVDFCGTVCIVEGDDNVDVYKKTGDTWAKVASLADDTGDLGFYPGVIQMLSDGSFVFGGDNGNGKIWMWDLSGTGTITASNIALPAGTITGAAISGVASNGSIIVGWCNGSTNDDNCFYWLASESYSTAHSLADYFIAQGMTQFGPADGKYTGLDTVTVSATGQHFVARMTLNGSPDQRSMYYVAVPVPT